jgi:hypothetical protein
MEAVLIDRDSAARRKVQGYLTAQGMRVAGEANDLASRLHMIRSLRQGILLLELPANPPKRSRRCAACGRSSRAWASS